MKLRLGTRRSRLAVTQSRQVARLLERAHDGLEVELVEVVTSGDRMPGRLAEIGGKGLFTLELERGLLDGDLDLAVHSLKDLPVDLPRDLDVVSVPSRAEAGDALVSEVADRVDDLPEGATVFTGSLRRRAQLLARRPDLVVEPMRGNVETRIEKWRASGAAAVVLALAGLQRLGLEDLPASAIDPEIMTPAPGQGALAVQTRRGSEAAELCVSISDPEALVATTAEREIVAAFGGDCTLPLGAWARPVGDRLRLSTFLGLPDGTATVRVEVEEDPASAADAAIERMRKGGADDIMKQLRSEETPR